MTGLAYMLRRLARDRSALLGLILVLLVVLAALLAPVISTHPEAVWDMDPTNRLKPPSGEWLFGTDRMGADIYSRVIYGARITLLIAFVAVGVSLLIGVPIGLWAGWNDLWIGEALMRVSDVFLAVPQIVLAIAIAQTLGPSIENVILALSVMFRNPLPLSLFSSQLKPVPLSAIVNFIIVSEYSIFISSMVAFECLVTFCKASCTILKMIRLLLSSR